MRTDCHSSSKPSDRLSQQLNKSNAAPSPLAGNGVSVMTRTVDDSYVTQLLDGCRVPDRHVDSKTTERTRLTPRTPAHPGELSGDPSERHWPKASRMKNT